jgi:two-component system response regulator DesR
LQVNKVMRILVVEDHAIVRDLLCKLLNDQPDMDIVAGVANGAAALSLLSTGIHADIVLTDLNMPGMSGLELTKSVVQLDSSTHVIILTMQPLMMVRERALLAGASECLSKDGSFSDLLACIRLIHSPLT